EIADVLAFPAEWYRSQELRVRLSTSVVSIDPAAHSLKLDTGETVQWDRLVIASGACPFMPPIPGIERKGVFSVRTAADALALREWAAGRKRAVVIGGGLLGLETARGLRDTGLDVSVLEFADRLLPRQLDDGGAQFLQRAVEKLGISIVTSAETATIDGVDVVTAVSLKDGRSLDAEAVVVSTGVRSSIGFLEGSGIETNRGIVVDGGMRTSAADAFAVGDVAEFEGVTWGIVPVALAQAAVAARFLTGDESKPYVPVPPSNALKITGMSVFSSGVPVCDTEGCVEHVSADESAGVYRKVVLQGGVIVGAIVMGSRVGVRELGTMIERGLEIGHFGDELVSDTFDFKGVLL
ncbi:FAD-dependent oxidoreductase, partial [bacterium]|nr:FAD-dependent oxidoreductase [bacterium]